jgi:putative peptidoglycan lipid II flippase
MPSAPSSTPGFAPSAEPPPAGLAGVARATSIIAAGNIVSRVLGLARDIAKSYFFGATGLVSAFNIAAKVPMWFYDLLAGGMVSAALVPVFSTYARPEKRAELWLIASFLLTLCVTLMTPLVLLGELFAPQIAWLVSGGMSAETLRLTASLLRLTLPAMLFLNFAGILAGLLYSLKRFTLPAFNAAIFNLGIVAATLLFARPFGVRAMAAGLLAGAALQVLLQLPGLRDTQLRPVLDWRHPALHRIARLYFPLVLGLLVDMVSRAISYRLASTTGDQSIAWMDYATTLMQFPLGLTSTAISVAILPTLARQAAGWSAPEDSRDFLATLAHALRLVLVLIIPATVGLFVLARPVVELIFEHGDFLPADTAMTTMVLRLYLLGIIAAAIDLLLINAFYARQDAWTPAIVGLVGVFIYLAAALTPSFFRPMRLSDLIVANAIQLSVHALTMWLLLHRRVGSLRGQRLGHTTSRAVLAAAAMAVPTMAALWGVGQINWPGQLLSELAAVLLPGAIGAAVYLALMNAMKVPELALTAKLIRRRNPL